MNPNIAILYIIGNYFLPQLIMRDRYLKRRFRLALINCQSYTNQCKNTCRLSRHFSLQMEGTIMKRRLRGIDLSQEPHSKVAEGGESMSWIHNLPTRSAPPLLVALRRLRTTFPPYSAPSDSSPAVYVAFWASFAGDHYLAVRLMRKREREAQWRRGERGPGGGRRAFAGVPLPVIMVDAGEGCIVAEGNKRERRERGSLSLVWLGHRTQSHNFKTFFFCIRGNSPLYPLFFEGKSPLCPWKKTWFYKYW